VWPDALRVAPTKVPVLLLPDSSAVVVPAASLKAYAATNAGSIGGAVFSTVTVTIAEVVCFPLASRAIALIVCVPLATLLEFHEML
jgi:hypothetical protein